MSESRLDYSEDLRQIEHLVPIAFAFLLPYLTWMQAVALAIFALIYGVFISPRVLRATRRPNEQRCLFSSGKAAYATSILALLLVFPKDMFVVAAVWANLAVGDAASNLIGRNFGRKMLPWNAQKTWLGCVSAFVLSTLMAALLIQWNGLPAGTHQPRTTAWLYAIALSLVCSLVETLPLPLDDNLTICIAGGAFMGLLKQASWPAGWDWRAFGSGLLVSAAVALLAWLLKTVSPSGAIWGTLFGSVVYYSLGLPGFVLLGSFFVLGSLFSKMGYKKKMRDGLAQANLGRRSARHVWGKGVAALFAAVAGIFHPDQSLVTLAFVTALAASLSDTTATELGQLLGKRPVLLGSFKSVPRGTPGAISAEGSVLGFAAASGIALAGYSFHFVSGWGVLWAVVAAVGATHLESYLVARHTGSSFSGPLMNALHTTLSMIFAVLLSRICL